MKEGDLGFIHIPERDNITHYVNVAKVEDGKITLDVINGNYTLVLAIVDVPKKHRADYNSAIGWFRDLLNKVS